MSIRIKICCIGSDTEAKLAVSYSASAIGLVGRMPSGPGPIADELIARIAKAVPPPIATFLLTCETTPDNTSHITSEPLPILYSLLTNQE